MAARVWGGVAGWIVGLLPLVAANVADHYIEFDSNELLLLGAGVLISGILLGGVISASLGGRSRDGKPGGTSAAGVAGGIAAALYAATIIAIVLSGRLVDSEPTLIAEHPLRASGVVVFLGALMVAVALTVGAFRSGKPAEVASRQAATARPPSRPYTQPNGNAPRSPSRPRAAWDDGDRRYPPRDPRITASGPRGYTREDAGPARERRDSGARISSSRVPQRSEGERWERR